GGRPLGSGRRIARTGPRPAAGQAGQRRHRHLGPLPPLFHTSKPALCPYARSTHRRPACRRPGVGQRHPPAVHDGRRTGNRTALPGPRKRPLIRPNPWLGRPVHDAARCRFRSRMDGRLRRTGRSRHRLIMSLEVLYALAAVAAWLLLTWFTLLRPSLRRTDAGSPAAAPDGARTAVVYASQTGTALDLAQRTAQALGRRAALLPMDRVMPADLRAYEEVLF